MSAILIQFFIDFPFSVKPGQWRSLSSSLFLHDSRTCLKERLLTLLQCIPSCIHYIIWTLFLWTLSLNSLPFLFLFLTLRVVYWSYSFCAGFSLVGLYLILLFTMGPPSYCHRHLYLALLIQSGSQGRMRPAALTSLDKMRGTYVVLPTVWCQKSEATRILSLPVSVCCLQAVTGLFNHLIKLILI